MSNQKISALADVGTLVTTDQVPVVRSGVTSRAQIDVLGTVGVQAGNNLLMDAVAITHTTPTVGWDTNVQGRNVFLDMASGNTHLEIIDNLAEGSYNLVTRNNAAGTALLSFDSQYIGSAQLKLTASPFAVDIFKMTNSAGATTVLVEPVGGELYDSNQTLVDTDSVRQTESNGTLLSTLINTAGGNFTQTGAARPTISDPGLNSLKSLNYDGADCMDGPVLDLSPNNGGFSIFAVVTVGAILAIRMITSIFFTGTQARMQFFIDATGVITARSMSGDADFKGRKTAAASVAINTPFVLNFNDSGGTSASNISIFNNNTQVDTTDDNLGTYTGMASTTRFIEIGAQAGSVFWLGNINEFYVVNRVLTAAQISSKNRQLGDKWGITVA